MTDPPPFIPLEGHPEENPGVEYGSSLPAGGDNDEIRE